MTIHFTCPSCKSGIHVLPEIDKNLIKCQICAHEFEVCFDSFHEKGILKSCPMCERKDFYSQRDFNRKLGVLIYLIPTCITIFVGLLVGIFSYFIFWILDLILYKYLNKIAICYKCETVFRNVENIHEIFAFNHEMNDRIVYSDHDFQGKSLEKH